MFDKRTHCLFVSVVAHALVIVIVLCQPKLAPVKHVIVSVTSAARGEPLWILASIDRPAPSGPAATEFQPHSKIVPAGLITAAEPGPTGNDDAVPPVDTEATNIGLVLESSAPVVRTNLKDIPRLDTDTSKSVAVQPPEIFSAAADGITADNQNSVIVEPAHVIKQVIPDYPHNARVARVQGQVLLKATITETGKVEDIVVVEGHPLLIEAAVAAVSRWRYEPAKLHGVPTRSPLNITVHFRLRFD
jgi:TonB family protein